MNRSPCVEAFALALAGLLGVCAGCSVNGSRRTTLGYDAATGRLVTMNEGGARRSAGAGAVWTVGGKKVSKRNDL